MKKNFKLFSLILAVIVAFGISGLFVHSFGNGDNNGGDFNGISRFKGEFESGVVLVGLYSEANTRGLSGGMTLKNMDDTMLAKSSIFDGLNVTSVDTLMNIDISKKANKVHAGSGVGGESTDVNLDEVEKIVAVYLENQNPEAVFEAIEILEAMPGVAYAGPDYIMRLNTTIPNDQYYSNLWGMEKIEAPLAWDIYTGSSDIVVAVIDSGIDYTHPDLAANMWINPNPTKGDIHGWDFVNNDNDPIDEHSHGTYIAGIIGAIGNNDIGVAGVNWSVKLAALKIVDSNGSGSILRLISAITYANQNEIPIINASLGSYLNVNFLFPIVNAIQNYNGLFIVAAGNDATDNDTRPHYPSSYDLPNIIAVGATNSSDNNVYNYGKNSVHLGAPGYGVWSTIPTYSSTLHPTNYSLPYKSNNGTSLATPYVVGAAALLMGYRPDLTPLEVKGIILASVDEVPQLADKYITGGRLNINKMLKMAVGDKLFTTSIPDLAYNRTTHMMTFNTVKLSAEGLFPSRVYVVINKYDDSNPNVPLGTVSGFVDINTDGIGTYTPVSSLVHFSVVSSYLEIMVYEGSGKQELIARQLVRPALFGFY